MSPETLLQDLLVTEICKYLKLMNMVKRKSHVERERQRRTKGPSDELGQETWVTRKGGGGDRN